MSKRSLLSGQPSYFIHALKPLGSWSLESTKLINLASNNKEAHSILLLLPVLNNKKTARM